MERIRVHLKPGRDKSVRGRHPWVFSGGIAREDGDPAAALAEVVAANGSVLGVGFYSPGAELRVRLLGPAETTVDWTFFAARLGEAVELRRRLVAAETTGYRVLNAEGDGVPGWTVDRLGEVLVSQITSLGLEALRAEAYAALSAAFPGKAILQNNDLGARRREGLATLDEVVSGAPGDETVFTENGLTFTGELTGGQKTGFYFDQRENRRRLGELAAGARVLDLFAHSGGFGLYALRGGAVQAVLVESSERLVERGRRHAEMNRAAGIDPDRAVWVQADVFADLRRRQDRYGLVVCDPPPLARRKGETEAAARAYKDLNRLALARVTDGGFFATFSCSAAIDPRLFRQILFAAANEAGVRLLLLEPLAAGPDHPISIYHPEGEYLKGWLGQVRPG